MNRSGNRSGNVRWIVRLNRSLKTVKERLISYIITCTPTFVLNNNRYSVDRLFLFVMYQFV